MMNYNYSELLYVCEYTIHKKKEKRKMFLVYENNEPQTRNQMRIIRLSYFIENHHYVDTGKKY